MKLPVQLAGRVVADQVVRAQVVDDALEAAGEIVRVDDGEAVGRFGERAQRVDPAAQHGLIDRRRDDRRRRPRDVLPHHRRVEDRQPARIDRVERRVGAVRLVEQIAELPVVVELRQLHPIGVALVVGRACRCRILGRQPARRGSTDDRRAGRHALARQRPRQVVVGTKQQPAVADRENRLALFAHAAQIADEILERVERQLFVAAIDHLGGDAVLVRAVRTAGGYVRVARAVLLVHRIGGNRPARARPSASSASGTRRSSSSCARR